MMKIRQESSDEEDNNLFGSNAQHQSRDSGLLLKATLFFSFSSFVLITYHTFLAENPHSAQFMPNGEKTSVLSAKKPENVGFINLAPSSLPTPSPKVMSAQQDEDSEMEAWGKTETAPSHIATQHSSPENTRGQSEMGPVSSGLLEKCTSVKVVSEALQGMGDYKECAFIFPIIDQVDTALAVKYVTGKRTYVEWGSGGSTNTFGLIPDRSYSIEHAKEWCGNVEKQPVFAAAVLNNKARYQCVDTGLQLQHFGYPVCPSNEPKSACYERFLPYLNGIEKAVEFFGTKTVDIVFIDGRMRKHCALKALAFVHKDSYLMFHDDDTRHYSEQVKDYYELVEKGLALTVMRPREEWIGNTDLWTDYATRGSFS